MNAVQGTVAINRLPGWRSVDEQQDLISIEVLENASRSWNIVIDDGLVDIHARDAGNGFCEIEKSELFQHVSVDNRYGGRRFQEGRAFDGGCLDGYGH